MAGFEAPSFSLGLDLDISPEPDPPSRGHASRDAASEPSGFECLHKFEDVEKTPLLQYMGSDPFLAYKNSAPVVRHLRRGRNATPASAPERKPISTFCELDDEIGVFNSQEDPCEDKICLAQNNSTLSNSKPTFSPIRRFRLLDSDSDDSSVSEGDFTSVDDNSRKGFSSTGNVSVPTPILDEVCEEYFQTLKGKHKDAAQKLRTALVTNDEQKLELCNGLSPAHRYFFNEDPRIQKLVRSRLPNFFPLESLNQNGKREIGAASIDYTKQFNHEEGSKGKAVREQIISRAGSKRKAARPAFSGGESPVPRKTRKGNTVKRSRKSKKESGISSAAKTSGGWVNPKSYSDNPTNAASRRVHAQGFTTCGWHTSNGTKVYVTKNGEQLTGRTAYQRYRKESSGAGFGKFKNKGRKKK